MTLTALHHKCIARPTTLHAVHHAADLGCVTRPFVQAQRYARIAKKTRRGAVLRVASSQEMEITLKADEVSYSMSMHKCDVQGHSSVLSQFVFQAAALCCIEDNLSASRYLP